MHLIGKEIIRFHCLYWPGLLIAAGLQPPSRVFAHGWMTKDGKKLSKSTGNIIDTKVLADQYGVDAVRYFLLREGTYGQDWDFTDQAFVTRFNADLANDFGNLVSRALTMVRKYCDGRVPARPSQAGRPGRGAGAFEQRLQLDPLGGAFRPGAPALRGARLLGGAGRDLELRGPAQPAHRGGRALGAGQGPGPEGRAGGLSLPPARGDPPGHGAGQPGHAARGRARAGDAGAGRRVAEALPADLAWGALEPGRAAGRRSNRCSRGWRRSRT